MIADADLFGQQDMKSREKICHRILQTEGDGHTADAERSQERRDRYAVSVQHDDGGDDVDNRADEIQQQRSRSAAAVRPHAGFNRTTKRPLKECCRTPYPEREQHAKNDVPQIIGKRRRMSGPIQPQQESPYRRQIPERTQKRADQRRIRKAPTPNRRFYTVRDRTSEKRPQQDHADRQEHHITKKKPCIYIGKPQSLFQKIRKPQAVPSSYFAANIANLDCESHQNSFLIGIVAYKHEKNRQRHGAMLIVRLRILYVYKILFPHGINPVPLR